MNRRALYGAVATVGLVACGSTDTPPEGPGSLDGSSGGGVGSGSSGGSGDAAGTVGSSSGAGSNGVRDSAGEVDADADASMGSSGSGAGAVDEGGPDGVSSNLDASADVAVAMGTFHVPFDWNGIVGNGQSLSVGARGMPVITTTQPFHNVKLFDPSGLYPLDAGGALSLVPLVEPIRAFCPRSSAPYPCNIYGETPHTALSIQLTTLAKGAGAADYVTLHSVVGQGAQPLSVLRKGGTGNAYAASLSEARTFKRLADAAGKKLGYVAVVFTHGEADNGNSGPYETGVYQLYQDYNTDLSAITGQTQPIALIASQQASSPPVGNGLTNAPLEGTALSVWHAGVDHRGQVLCAGPKYQYKYYATNGIGGTDPHVYAAGYRRLGEKYAEIIDAIANRGAPWTPLEPSRATLSGAVLTVTFDVPNPPLAWEPSLAVSTTVSAWKNGRGFEVVDSTGPLTINDAQIAGDGVVLTLAAAPAGSGLRVRYATYNGCTGNCGDHLVGQLRDSDAFVGADAQTVSCTVTQGSTSVVCPAAVANASPLSAREVHDVVTGSGLPRDTVVVATDKATQASLSSAWTGASGTTSLTFAYDERNYAVQFDLQVP